MPRLHGADLGALLAQALDAETLRDRERARVIGHDHVLVPARLGGLDQTLERMVAVGPFRVVVQVAAQVAAFDEHGQAALARGIDLATVLAQLRRDPRQPHRGVDVRFGLTRHPRAGRFVEDAVLADLQSAARRHLAQPHVVRLGAREVLQRRAERLGRDDTQVDREPLLVTHGDLCLAACGDLGHRRQAHQRLDDPRRLRRCDEDVDVLHRLAHPAQRAGDLQPLDAAVRTERGGHLGGDAARRREQRAGAARLVLRDRLQEVLARLFLDARHADDAAAPAGLFEAVDGVDAEQLPERTRRARTQTAHLE